MKLVRDNIPRLHPQHEYHAASARELAALLKLKVVEEAGEGAGARNVQELTEEIADLMEVLSALRWHYKISLPDVSRIRSSKANRLGAFHDGWVMTDFTKGEE